MAQLFYDDNADLAIIQGRKVAVLGYGSQGHAHALSLRDSGVDERVGLAEGADAAHAAEDFPQQILALQAWTQGQAPGGIVAHPLPPAGAGAERTHARAHTVAPTSGGVGAARQGSAGGRACGKSCMGGRGPPTHCERHVWCCQSV